MSVNHTTLIPNTPSTSSFWNSVKENSKHVQFQSALFSTVVATTVTIGINWTAQGISSVYHNWNYKHIDLQKTVEAYEQGLTFLEKQRKYPEALKSFIHAKMHFEKTLSGFSKSNTRLHELYYNICHSVALAQIQCGNLEEAEKTLDLASSELKKWGSSYCDYDLVNLRGVIYLKQNKIKEAHQQFEDSLRLNANQKEIIYLYSFTEETPAELPDSLDLYLTNSDLFKPSIIHPIAFEINMAYIASHFRINKVFLQCFYNFNLINNLQDAYTGIDLPFSDRDRMYRLTHDILDKLNETFPEEAVIQSLEEQKIIVPSKKEIERLILVNAAKKDKEAKINSKFIVLLNADQKKSNGSSLRLYTIAKGILMLGAGAAFVGGILFAHKKINGPNKSSAPGN